MVATVDSKVEIVNLAIREQNPFSQPPYVKAKHIWDKGFPDVESLNAHASDAVFKALDEIRAKHYSSTSLLITAQDGTGKSHIISRIRYHLRQNGKALFIFANQFNDLNEVKQGFQNLLAVSLGKEGSQEITQWQKVAANIANIALSISKPGGAEIEANVLIKKFTNNSVEKVGKWVQKLCDLFCENRDIQDREIIKAILWCLSDSQKTFAVNWLAGEELAQYKANELRLPSQREGFNIVLQILDIISQFYELVICFDELDIDEFDERGLHKSQVVAGLVKDLFENLNRGLILSTMMPGTWNNRVKQLPGGVWNKMIAQGRPYELKYMDEKSIVKLVEFSLENYYKERDITPPYALYPFDENELKDIGKEKPTVREVLRWCRENCLSKLKTADTSEEISLVEQEKEVLQSDVGDAFRSEIESIDSSYWEQNKIIGNALFFSFRLLISCSLNNIEVFDVTDGVKSRGGRDPYLNFKIIGKESGADFCIGVAVLQNNGGRSLGAGFKRLLDKKGEFNITRGCLVRSQDKPLNRYFRDTYLEPLIHDQGGEWVDLLAEEIQPLIAIHNVYRKREEYDLTEEQIFEFIENADPKLLLDIHSPILQEILSSPTHQVPETIDEPELENVDPEELLEQPVESNTIAVAVSASDSHPELDLLDKVDEEDLSEEDDLADLAKDD
ncbi:MAG: hypothetical protein AAF821_21545 [Cyanobacteria bacterium P01_D01_bin.156]